MTTDELKSLLGSVMIQQVNGDNLWWGPGTNRSRQIIEEVLDNPDSPVGSHYVVQIGALVRAANSRNNHYDE